MMNTLKIESLNYDANVQKIHDQYAAFYNATKNKVQATANLVTIKNGFKTSQKEINNRNERLIAQLIHGIEKVRNDSFEQCKGSERASIHTVTTVIEHANERLKWGLSLFKEEIPELKKMLISDYGLSNENSGDIEHLFKEMLDSIALFRSINIHAGILELLLFDIIREAYPTKLRLYNDLTDLEKRGIKKRGRKFDISAPQNKIEEKVLELAKKKRFQDKDGNPKPTTITKEIADKHSELMGDIQERALFTRVQEALK